MYIKKWEYETLLKISALLPSGDVFEALPEADKAIITTYDALLVNLHKRQQESNRKTAEYIAEKRKTNKNYAR